MQIALYPVNVPTSSASFVADQPHDELHQRALIRGDLHHRVRHHRRLGPHPIEHLVRPRAVPAQVGQQLLSRFDPAARHRQQATITLKGRKSGVPSGLNVSTATRLPSTATTIRPGPDRRRRAAGVAGERRGRHATREIAGEVEQSLVAEQRHRDDCDYPRLDRRPSSSRREELRPLRPAALAGRAVRRAAFVTFDKSRGSTAPFVIAREPTAPFLNSLSTDRARLELAFAHTIAGQG